MLRRSMPPVEFVKGINHRDIIFNVRFRLYIVNRIENESSARREYFASAQW